MMGLEEKLEQQSKDFIAGRAILFNEAALTYVYKDKTGKRMVSRGNWDKYIALRAKAEAYGEMMSYMIGAYAAMRENRGAWT